MAGHLFADHAIQLKMDRNFEFKKRKKRRTAAWRGVARRGEAGVGDKKWGAETRLFEYPRRTLRYVSIRGGYGNAIIKAC